MSALWFLTAGFPNKILYFPKSVLHTLTEATSSGMSYQCKLLDSGEKNILYHNPYGISLP